MKIEKAFILYNDGKRPQEVRETLEVWSCGKAVFKSAERLDQAEATQVLQALTMMQIDRAPAGPFATYLTVSDLFKVEAPKVEADPCCDGMGLIAGVSMYGVSWSGVALDRRMLVLQRRELMPGDRTPDVDRQALWARELAQPELPPQWQGFQGQIERMSPVQREALRERLYLREQSAAEVSHPVRFEEPRPKRFPCGGGATGPCRTIDCQWPACAAPSNPASEPSGGGVPVLIMYSAQDAAYAERLKVHMSSLVRRQEVEILDWRAFQSGSRVRNEADMLARARVTLFLVSSDSLGDTLPTLERAHHASKVVPILIRSCLWQSESIGSARPLPRNETPVQNWPDKDSAWNDVLKGVTQLVRSLR